MCEHVNTSQPMALRLADKYEAHGFLGDHSFAKEQWCSQAAVELRHQHKRISKLEATHFTYASEFKPGADGDPDVSKILANIRKLKAKVGKLQQKLAAEAEKNAEEKRRTARLDKIHSQVKKQIEEHLKREAARQDLKEYP